MIDGWPALLLASAAEGAAAGGGANGGLLLVPVLLLLILPGLLLAWRLGVPRRRPARWLAAGAALGLVLAAVPWSGVDFDTLKRLNLLTATAVVALLLAEQRGFVDRRRAELGLLVLTSLTVLVYYNFGAFRGHGVRAWVHLHDVGHYYLGTKYAEELGYADLYTAMLRAEAEDRAGQLQAAEARDLATYRRVPSTELVIRSDAVKAAFSAERWFDFKRDAGHLRERLGAHYPKMLLDHGFNPTPVWNLFGSPLANAVPAGSATGLLLLTLIDPLLLLLTFGAVARGFGRRAMLLAILLFCLTHGATFGWVGGAFLRYGWLFATVGAAVCLKRRQHGAAGALLALASALRVFPVFFFLPLAAKALLSIRRRGAPSDGRRRLTLPGPCRRFLTGAAATGLLLFLATGLLPRGFDGWWEFRENMQLHTANISPNVVGVTEVLSHRWGVTGLVSQEEFDALKTRRQTIHRAQLLLVLLPLLAWAVVTSRRRPDLEAMALGAPLLLSAVGLAGYYTVFLLLLLLAFGRVPRAVILIFVCEALCWSFRLFETREARLYIYRSIALAWLYLVLFWPRLLSPNTLPASASPPPATPDGVV